MSKYNKVKRFIFLKSICEMERMIEELTMSLRRNGIEKFPTPNRVELTRQEKTQIVQYVIFGAFYPNYFIRKHTPNDLREVHKLMNGRDPMNSVYLKGFPPQHAKFGALYKDPIKEMFSLCSDPEDIDVEFDGSKVLVQFIGSGARRERKKVANMAGDVQDISTYNRDNNLTGEIVHQVYTALKVGSDPRNRGVKLYPEDTATQKMEEYDRAKTKMKETIRANDFRRLMWVSPPSIEVEVNSCTCLHLFLNYFSDGETFSLFDGKRVHFDIVHADNPSSFWVQYLDAGHVRKMRAIDKVVEEFKTVKGSLPKLKICQIRRNHVYMATFDNDGHLYRARVEG